MRVRYVLCYDISDDSRLRRVAGVAEDFGHRIQYSIFVCDLSKMERLRLEDRLRRELHADEDRVLLVELGPASSKAPSRMRWISTGRRDELLRPPEAPQIV